MHYTYFMNRLDVECCHYNDDCCANYSDIKKIIISLFNSFIAEDSIIPNKKETIERMYSAISPCGYTEYCGENNIEEVVAEIYTYFENSMSDDFKHLTAPKAVELGLINYDNHVRFTTTPFTEMDEEWTYKKAFSYALYNLQRYSCKTRDKNGDRVARTGWEKQFKKAEDSVKVLFAKANKKEVIEKIFENCSFELKNFMQENISCR